MLRYLKLYPHFMAQQLKTQLEYPVSFVVGALSGIIDQGVVVASLFLIMNKAPSLQGWSLYQIQMVYAFVALGMSLNRMFTDNLWSLGWMYLRTGDFIRFLTRPINPLYFYLSNNFTKEGIGDFLVGMTLLVVSSIKMHVHWNIETLFYAAVMIISSGAIFFGMNLIVSSLSFWVLDSQALILGVWQTHEFAKYPLSIYPRGIQMFFSFVIPYGLSSFFPASFILGKSTSLLIWAPPIAAAIVIAIGYALWTNGIKRYTGTGS